MKNILFVLPKFVDSKGEPYILPLGILYLATILQEKNYIVKIIDMNEYCDDNEVNVIGQYIQDNEVDLVCTGGLSAFFNSIERIILAVRELLPTKKIVLGGGIVTSDRDFIANILDPDIVVIGEGEITLPELVDTIFDANGNLSNVKGIGYKKDNKWIFTEERELLEDMSIVPMPNYDLINIEEYFKRQHPISSLAFYPVDFPRELPIVTSRSCPLKCTFCFHPTGQKYRMKDLDSVFEEIEYMIQHYKINLLGVLDEMMSASKSRLVEFSHRIKKYNILWSCQLLVSSIDDETLAIMKESGCYYVSYGLESMNNDILKSMKKHGVTREKIEKALELTVKHSITIQGNFIFGDLLETKETAHDTLSWWKAHPKYQISLGRISPYPGTHLYTHCLSNGIIKDREKFMREGTPSLNMSKMTPREYSDLISEIAIASSLARQYCEVLSVIKDDRVEEEAYVCELKCPHCNEVVRYGNIRIHKPIIFKMGCRNCSLRFDVNPKKFPHLAPLLEKEKEKVLQLKEKYCSFILSPCIFEGWFLEYFDLIGIHYQDLNIKYVLDSSDARIGELYLDKYQIIKRDIQLLSEWKDSAILIMSARYNFDISREFIELGTKEEQILTVKMI
mgnify:CR=1 FL=1